MIGVDGAILSQVVSNLIKPRDQRLNVQLSAGDEKNYNAFRDSCKVSRNPPVSPATFEAQLDKRIFTNGHTDKQIVVELYTRDVRHPLCPC